MESVDGTLRDELLAREAFDSLLEAKVVVARWRKFSPPRPPAQFTGRRGCVSAR